jgi:DNA-binding MarR family transcriptional regulator
MLPDELSSDNTWVILVDLFRRQLRSENIRASDWESRFGISEGTAARMLAGFIGAGLIRRLQRSSPETENSLVLTDSGFTLISAIFSSYK